MNGLTNYITERSWTDIVTTWYVLVDDAYQRLIAKRGLPLRTSGPEPDLAAGEVPIEFSQELYTQAKQAGKTAELYTCPGDDHNLASSLTLAMPRTIAFFDKYVNNIGS
jgi:hypothetical protein